MIRALGLFPLVHSAYKCQPSADPGSLLDSCQVDSVREVSCGQSTATGLCTLREKTVKGPNTLWAQTPDSP